MQYLLSCTKRFKYFLCAWRFVEVCSSPRHKPWYLEECSSTLATTYSSGTPGLDNSVATVDMDGALRPEHICTVEHTGDIDFLVVFILQRFRDLLMLISLKFSFK